MSETTNTVVDFPSDKPTRKLSSTEGIWSKSVVSHGYAGVPAILIRSQGAHELEPDAIQHHYPAAGILVRREPPTLSHEEGYGGPYGCNREGDPEQHRFVGESRADPSRDAAHRCGRL